MTEKDWLESDDPGRMLYYLAGGSEGLEGNADLRRTSLRKLRLFAVACWQMSPLSRPNIGWDQALRELEELAEGQRRWFTDLVKGYVCAATNINNLLSQLSALWLGTNLDAGQRSRNARLAAGALRDIVGNPLRPAGELRCAGCDLPCPSHIGICANCGTQETRRRLPKPWLTPTVLSLAQATYDDRDWQRLLAVADALEEAGCPAEEKREVQAGDCCLACGQRTRQAGEGFRPEARYCDLCRRTWVRGEHYLWPVPNPLLAHLRSPGPHYRGCHVLDLILGKE